MNKAEQKIVQYLSEARGMERALAHVLQSQIAMTPKGAHRNGLESHLQETYDHGERVQRRLDQLGAGGNPLSFGVNLLRSVVGEALALGKAPVDLVRGSGGEERVLKNAKDACAAEGLEIATYTAIERLADSVADKETAALAASIRADEQKMLDRLLRQIPALTDAVMRAELRGDPSYKLSKTGAADGARATGRTAKKGARRRGASVKASAKRTARQARRAPSVARAEGRVKGGAASDKDLPIANYDRLSGSEITDKLSDLSQADLAKVDAYERRGENRATILVRIGSLRASEPWPGYDELNVSEIRSALGGADEERVKRARFYERSHKNREGVLEATGPELTNVR
jgi:ferritin-like metal-binding protein YciE